MADIITHFDCKVCLSRRTRQSPWTAEQLKLRFILKNSTKLVGLYLIFKQFWRLSGIAFHDKAWEMSSVWRNVSVWLMLVCYKFSSESQSTLNRHKIVVLDRRQMKASISSSTRNTFLLFKRPVFIWQVDISNYIESNEWELVDHPAKKNVRYYSCCIEPFPDLTFTITIKRVAVFYSYILVLPCLLLSFITLVIFWLPPESPAKMMLGW